MDPLQQRAVEFVNKRHNLVLTGQAGTGKTYVIKHITNILANKVSIAITASTAIAATHHGEGVTLHKWSGIGDGRYSNDELLYLLSNDERFADAKERILKTELLIIDEVSMISKKVLSQVEFICRRLRSQEKNELFGGIQVVLVGDFYQLPPVKNVMYGDNGNYAFEMDWFESMFKHKINLTTVFRQSQPQLCLAVNELEQGCPSEETNKFLKGLCRPLEDSSDVVKLFARNIDVDLYNAAQLEKNGNPQHLFTSEDDGSIRHLKKIQALKYLAIKKDAPVVLITNLSDQLVNGLIGSVCDVNSNEVLVQFHVKGRDVLASLKKQTFSKYDPVKRTNVATRIQYPIKLAYGLTMHKAQGMSLNKVEVDCSHVINPGQIGVAVGRAVSIEGLRMVNYNPILARKHPPEVNMFYDTHISTDVDACNSLKCCRFEIFNGVDHKDDFISDLDDDSDFDNHTEKEEDLLMHLDSEVNFVEHSYSMVENVSSLSKDLINRAFEDFTDTPAESDARACVELLTKNGYVLNEFISSQEAKVKVLFEECVPEKSKPKHFTSFYTNFHAYLNSQEYTDSVNKVVAGSEIGRQLLTTVLFIMQKDILEQKARCVSSSPSTLKIQPSTESEISTAGRGKIRYIGGYTLAKIKYRLSREIHANLHVPGMELELNKMKLNLDVVDSLTISASEITMVSQYKDSLEETARKQYISEGLTNINDKTFEFFELLERKTRELLSVECLTTHGKHLFRNTQDILLKDNSILADFCSTCMASREKQQTSNEKDIPVDNIVNCVVENLVDLSVSLEFILKQIINLFLTVSVSQFRKDYLTAIKREKSKALRKKVIEKTSKTSKTTQLYVDMDFLQKDTSQNKLVSHLKLKAEALENEHFYTRFTKEQLLKIVKAYGTNVPRRKLKAEIGKELVLKLKVMADIPHPEILS